jgi:hypothetical protein
MLLALINRCRRREPEATAVAVLELITCLSRRNANGNVVIKLLDFAEVLDRNNSSVFLMLKGLEEVGAIGVFRRTRNQANAYWPTGKRPTIPEYTEHASPSIRLPSTQERSIAKIHVLAHPGAVRWPHRRNENVPGCTCACCSGRRSSN